MANDMEYEVLENLVGKLSLAQTKNEREAVTLRTVNELYSSLPQQEKIKLTKNVLSYDFLDEHVNDPYTEDIIINGLESIYIISTATGTIKLDKKFKSNEELLHFVNKLLVLSCKRNLDYVNNFHLYEGGRINIINSPLGYYITIRKFRQKPFSLLDLIERNSLNFDIGALLWLYVDGLGVKPANLIIAGMPGSGKTTLLNALFSFVPPDERVVVIEDTLELNTSTNTNCARLESDSSISMRDLVKNSLRMRPTRIVVGEVRGEEAIDLMTAMNIGKICMGTIHAGSPRETMMRLGNEPMSVPTDSLTLIDAVIVIKHFFVESKPVRVLSNISETGGIEERKILLSDLYAYNPKAGKIEELKPSIIYRDRLAEATGFTPKEIMDEIKLRSTILKKLLEKNIKTMDELAKFSASYYSHPDEAMQSIGLK
ncbi:CpaF family protein [Candidatus Micrarchaeota archaeon]|nr:CpaF family protein [Candidatus Micrarchaeota archaeon]